MNRQHQESNQGHGHGVDAQRCGFQDVQQQAQAPGHHDAELSGRPEGPVKDDKPQPLGAELEPAHREPGNTEHQRQHNRQGKQGVADHRQHQFCSSTSPSGTSGASAGSSFCWNTTSTKRLWFSRAFGTATISTKGSPGSLEMLLTSATG